MNRRETLKTILSTSGSLAILPTWANGWNIGNMIPTTTVFSAKEINTIRKIADTLIPESKGIGAIAVGVDVFLIKLFSDCYPEEVQKNIKTQLIELDKRSEDQYWHSFDKCIQAEREAILLTFNSENENEKKFFSLLKSETIRGFNTSESVLVDHLGYVMAPGFWNGCSEL